VFSGFGRAAGWLLALAIAARVGVSFLLPCESWGPSGYLCAAERLFLPTGGQRVFAAGRAFGEGVRVGNRLNFQALRAEAFTVDERGFRNPSIQTAGQTRVILLGSSFSLGMSLNDNEILSEQLNSRLGPVVYNASSTFGSALSAEQVVPLAAELGMNRGWVLLELLNRAPYSFQPAGKEPWPQNPGLRAEYLRWRARVAAVYRRIHDPFALTRISSELNMRLHDGDWLPNPFAAQYPEEELVNGQRMLFYRDDRQFFRNSPMASSSVQAVAQFRQELADAGLRLAVLLVPSGYSVYYPLLRRRDAPDSAFLQDLSSGLTQAGIPVLNAQSLLREAASRGLASGRLVYWPDDAHWNPAGCSLVAEAAAPWLRSLIGEETGLQP
jgi:hypothetical protein